MHGHFRRCQCNNIDMAMLRNTRLKKIHGHFRRCVWNDMDMAMLRKPEKKNEKKKRIIYNRPEQCDKSLSRYCNPLWLRRALFLQIF